MPEYMTKPFMSHTFSTQIDVALETKLRADLSEQGFAFHRPAYTLFAAQKKGVTCTLYQSGKLVVQGKGSAEFIAFYLEPEILGHLAYSYPMTTIDTTPRIGSDESGKGDFFGPLCVAAVYADAEQISHLVAMGVRDSKALSDATALELSRKICHLCAHRIVRINPLKYNELYDAFRNLNHLLAWGHAAAIADLVQRTQCNNILIDQFTEQKLVENLLIKKEIAAHVTQRPRAESDPVVAAASIVARADFLLALDGLGKEVAHPLPKGASQAVLQCGRQLVHTMGKEVLTKVAKLHFKTTREILA